MKRQQGLPEAAAEITHTAAERAEELYDAAVKKLGPLLEQAEHTVTPLAMDAKKKGAAFAATQMDKAQPAIEDVVTKLVNDVLPKVQEGLRNAAEVPVAAADKLEPTKKQLKQFTKVTKKQAKQLRRESSSGTGSKIGILALVAGVIGAAVVLLRRYLNQTDESGWAAHEPSMAYSPEADKAKDKAAGFMADVKDKASDAADKAKDMAGDAADKAKDMAGDAKDKAQHLAADVKDKADDAADKAKDMAGDAKDKAQDMADDAKDKAQDMAHDAKDKAQDMAHDAKDKAGDAADKAKDMAAEAKDKVQDYGPGSFVGEHAPDNFVIKGNERSMKYHVQGTEGYERTIPDVWFDSEEAAEAAGFTKAQR